MVNTGKLSPLVSIIIPCYNKGAFINETLTSIMRQTFSNWECLIIDDGSTDVKTKEILGRITNSKIHVYFRENNGVSKARNFGVGSAKGKYILPLDADDFLEPEFLEMTVNVMERDSSVKVCSTDVKLFGAKRGMMRLPDYSFQRLLARNILVVSCVFRKSDFDQMSGYDSTFESGFEDWDFWISFLADSGKVHKIGNPLFCYRILRKSRNSNLSKDVLRGLRLKIFTKHKDKYANNFIDPTETFEYKLIEESKEYRIGKIILKPLRRLISLMV